MLRQLSVVDYVLLAGTTGLTALVAAQTLRSFFRSLPDRFACIVYEPTRCTTERICYAAATSAATRGAATFTDSSPPGAPASSQRSSLIRNGTVAAVFDEVDSNVVRRRKGPSHTPAEAVLPMSCLRQNDVLLLPAAFLDMRLGESMTVTVPDVTCAESRNEGCLSVSVSLHVGLPEADIERYLSLHGRSPPHTMVAEAVSRAVRECAKVARPYELKAVERRVQIFDQALRAKLILMLPALCGVRLIRFTVRSVESSDAASVTVTAS